MTDTKVDAHILNKFDLAGHTAVVTGGAGLLGAEYCRTLAEAGVPCVVGPITRARAYHELGVDLVFIDGLKTVEDIERAADALPDVPRVLNSELLSGEEAAIVTEVAGTTRDILRETINIDGLAVELTYLDGRLATATTRGDGLSGHNQTKNS